MLSIYGNTWSSQYGLSAVRADGELTQAGRGWAESIGGLKPSHLAAGITAAQRSGREFPPNAARFRVLALGLPDLDVVEAELAPGQDRSPFTVLTWSKLDQYRYRTSDGKQQRRLLSTAYDLALRDVQKGEPLPPPMKALSPPRRRPPAVVDRDRARSAMEQAAEELGYVQQEPEA